MSRHCEAMVVDCDIDVIDRVATARRARRAARRDGGRGLLRRGAQPRRRPAGALIDLTEWDPPLDPTDLSALTAARWVAECLAGFEER